MPRDFILLLCIVPVFKNLDCVSDYSAGVAMTQGCC